MNVNQLGLALISFFNGTAKKARDKRAPLLLVIPCILTCSNAIDSKIIIDMYIL